MNTNQIGCYIAQKRKEQQMTQEDLANKLGITNKAVSKWENGRCLPDISLFEELCSLLNISLNELMAGRDLEEKQLRDASEQTIKEVWTKYSFLLSMKDIFIGILLILTGRILPIASPADTASDAIQFIVGVSEGVSIGITLIGITWLIMGAVKFSQKSL